MDREEQVLAEVLNEYRIKNKLSYQDIANHIGMSRYTVRDYMKGTSRMYWSTVINILDVLGVEVSELAKKMEYKLKHEKDN